MTRQRPVRKVFPTPPLFISSCSRSARGLLLCAISVGLMACVTPVNMPERIALHTFRFDAGRFPANVKLLDFRYGDGKVPGTSMATLPPGTATPLGDVLVHERMKVGHELYVRWWVGDPGRLCWRLVKLDPHLPSDMENVVVSFRLRECFLILRVEVPARARPAPEATPDSPARSKPLSPRELTI